MCVYHNNLNQRRERAENFLSFDLKPLITYEQGLECMRRRQEFSYSALLVLKSGKIGSLIVGYLLAI